MENTGNISVIIPVWNRAQLLPRAIMSVLKQSLVPNELIVVDDGSSDGSGDIARSFIPSAEAKEICMKVLTIDHCGFPGMVRNIGIKTSKSEWLAFLDSDDEWIQDKLEKQVARVYDTELLWCHTRELWIRDNKIVSQSSHRHKREGDIFEDALVKCIVGPSTVVIHKRLFQTLGLFKEDLEIAEDYELFLRLLDSYPIAYVEEGLVKKYDGAKNQLSHKYDYIEIFRIKALETLISDNKISYNKLKVATQELKRKKHIWEQGKNKRNASV